MNALVLGLVAGCLLSLGRARVGLDPYSIVVPAAWARYGLRALALGATALGIALVRWPSERAAASDPREVGPGDVARLLAGTLVGYGLHGLLLGDVGAPALSDTAFVALAVLIVARLAPRRREAPEGAEGGPSGPNAAAGPLALLGVAIAGAGAAISLEGAARWIGLMSDGARADDAGFAFALLATACVGALAFGPLVGARALRGVAVPVGLAGAATAGLASLAVLGGIASPRGLFRYFHHPVIKLTGIESTRHGTLPYDLVIGASCFVVPGMLIGAALCAARRRRTIAAALAGAAVGLLCVPPLLTSAGVDPQAAERAGRISPDLVPLGALVAGAGGVLAALAARRPIGPRLGGALAAGALALLPLAVRVAPAVPVAPWRKVSPMPRALLETREGMLVVEANRGGVEAIAIDGRTLAPGAERAEGDAERLRLSMRLCDPFRRARSEASVLLLGQLTPGRWHALSQLGAARVDRCAPYARAMGTLERAVFAGAPPPGDVLGPADAERRIERGDYDLVLVPSVAGDQPRNAAGLADELAASVHRAARHGQERPCVVALWLDARHPLKHADLGERVLLAADGVAGLGVGLVRGTRPELEEGLAFVAPGPATWWPASPGRLLERDEERGYDDLRRFAERLARAAPSPEDQLLPRALAAYFGAQRRSSPYEDDAARIELPGEALDALLEHSRGRPLDAFTRGLWEEIARVLGGKRWVPEILEVLPPLLEEHGEWPVVQRVVAQALLESFEPEEALLVLTEHGEPADWDGWACVGEARRMLDDHAGAAEGFRRALELAHEGGRGHHAMQRALAIEAVLSGAPDADELLGAALEENPEDEGLLPYGGPGPWPEPEGGFRPWLFDSH